jgi:hypothetical protein
MNKRRTQPRSRRRRGTGARGSGIVPYRSSGGSEISGARSVRGSLPLDLRMVGADRSEVEPALLLAPPHLRSTTPPDDSWPAAAANGESSADAGSPSTVSARERVTRRSDSDFEETRRRPGGADRLRAEGADWQEDGGGQAGSFDAQEAAFAQFAKGLLDDSPEAETQFRAAASDASYDFEEYLLLRNPDEPYGRIPSRSAPGVPIPSDPRFHRYLRAAENVLRGLVAAAQQEVALERSGETWRTMGEATHAEITKLDPLAVPLQAVLVAWWREVCAVRAFNRLSRYSSAQIRKLYVTPEELYAGALSSWLRSDLVATDPETGHLYNGRPAGFIKEYLESNGNPTWSSIFLSEWFWQRCLAAVFTTSAFANLKATDPAAPDGDYPFELFPTDEVLFGLRVVHRQTWRQLGYARGDLQKTIPLGPRETKKVSVKVVRRRKETMTSERTSSFETSSEAATTTKDSSEVVDEATRKFNWQLNAEVKGSYGAPVGARVEASISGGMSEDTSSASKQANTRLNEMMEKTASRMKRDTKIVVSGEGEDTFEETAASELTNPNDEVGVTYLYRRLQLRYWVSTAIGEVDSVVFIPEAVPAWGEINDDWIRAHGEALASALLDPSFAPVLGAIRSEPGNLSYTPGTVFADAADRGLKSTEAYKDFSGGGAMPDILASGQAFYERDFERRNNLAMEQERRKHQAEALRAHIRRNILHYMRAIWAGEEHDQRMQRYSRMRVPTRWTFVPRNPLPTNVPAEPLEVSGVFMPSPSSERPLSEVIDPIGPIGYYFNCAIYRLRDDPKLVNLHQALAYLRAGFAKFAVSVSLTPAQAGFRVRQVVPESPRRFMADYTVRYRSGGGGKWLVARAGASESEWPEAVSMPDGSLDVFGIRIWLAGTPKDGTELSISLRVTGEIEDPHLRLVALLNPLPAGQEEEEDFFTEGLLKDMQLVVPDLAHGDGSTPVWKSLMEDEKARFRAAYHRYLMLRESGRLVTIDTPNLVLDIETSRSSNLEPFKRAHRYVDVVKEWEEYRRRYNENRRRERLLAQGRLGDPEIERVTIVGGPAAGLIARDAAIDGGTALIVPEDPDDD